MADARFPDRWLTDRRVMRLSPAAFRSFVLALTYSVSNRTDGYLDREDLGFCGASPEHGPELVSAGLWKSEGSGWLAVDYLATQTSRAEFEVLENLRRRERLKKQQQRLNRSGKSTDEPDEGTVPGDNPGEVDGGQHRQEQEQERGQDVGPAHSATDREAAAQDWPLIAVPGGCSVCGGRMTYDDGSGTHTTCDPLKATA